MFLTQCLLGVAASVPTTVAAGVVAVARNAEPIVVTGAQVPRWSQLAAIGDVRPWPHGARDPEFDIENPFQGERDAHAGTVVAPPADVRAGMDPGRIAAFRWTGSAWVEIPVQVDERFPYFLSNPTSGFSFYSGVDEELTYAWDVESWKKTAGECFATYPPGAGATLDPVPALDDDDEIVFMASDAGDQAPSDATGPPGTGSTRQQIALVDPLDPTNVRYAYLFLRDGGSSFDATTGYVRYERDANADEWIDRFSIARDDPETLGTGNTGYGPNLSGTVCRTAVYPDYPTDPDGAPRASDDRFPRDGVTVTTDAYRWRATGRWMVRDMHVAKPEQPGAYGPDLVDRWKGRAFQQNPDSEINLVGGFEEEQTNWEANSALLGERAGPVRAIREVWGADSGTNTTKTETFYRDAVVYRYHTRVHPVPPDGIYQSFDYNAGVAVKYFNTLKPEGVDIDGTNDDFGNIDKVGGRPLFFDAPDPTFNVPLATGFWDQVSGSGDFGSLVYIYESKSPTSAENPMAFPFYRDDECFDDGTGDDPVPRPWPGDPSTDTNVKNGYAAQAGKPYDQLTCVEKQGAWGTHGLHVFFTNDTDNAFQSKPVTEVDAQQWQFAVPTEEPPQPVGEAYANFVRAPLRPFATEQRTKTSRCLTASKLTG